MPSREIDGPKSFLAGGFAGIATVLAGHPFDTLKVRLQTSNNYKGLADCFRQTIAKDGLTALYRGMTAPLIGVTPMFALSFWSYEVGQNLVKSVKTTQEMTMTDYALAGAFSAIPTTIERIKVIMQTQDQVIGGRRYTGMMDCGTAMVKEGGINSLYRGTVATLARDVPGSAAYFVAYEFFYSLLRTRDNSISIGATLFSGGMAGVAMWSIAIPPDVIKSRIQAAPAGTYKGFMDCATKIITKEGPTALFKGLGPALLRAFPANAAGFLGRAASLEVMHQVW